MAVFDDLAGSLHAALLFFVAIATGGTILSFRSRPTGERIARTIVLAVFVGVAFYIFGIRYRGFGLPVSQLVLLLACGVAGLFVGPRRVHQVFSSILLVAACGIFLWHAILVQGSYTGLRGWVGGEQQRLDREVEDLKARLTKLGQAETAAYSPGWLDETDLYRTHTLELRGFAMSGTVERSRRLWHTWLTGLFARVPVQRAIWYPGGRMVEGAPLMEWRDRQ